MEWRESITCQNCISLNKKLELFDLLKQKCCRNDDIAKNLLSLKKAYEKSTKVLASKSNKLSEVRVKLKDAGKNEENLKRKVAEFQLRLVSSDTKYQDILKDLENEREKSNSLSKAKSHLDCIIQTKENEMASLLLISKQSEEQHSNEIQKLKSEIEKHQEVGKSMKEHRQYRKKLEKLESQLHNIFKDGLDLSKENSSKLKRIINRISSKISGSKLEAELNSPFMTPDGTPSLDTGIFSGDEDFENPTIADDLLMSSESSDDDFEGVEETENKKNQGGKSSPPGLLSFQRTCDNSSSRDFFDDAETTLCPSNTDSDSFVGSPSGHSTQMFESNEASVNNQQNELTSTKECFSSGMKSSTALPDLCLSELPENIDTRKKISTCSSAYNFTSNVPNVEVDSTNQPASTLPQDLNVSVNSPLKSPLPCISQVEKFNAVDNILSHSLTNSDMKTQDVDQFKNDQNHDTKHEETELVSTADKSLHMNKGTSYNDLCIGDDFSLSQPSSEIKLTNDELKTMENEKNPELSSCELESMLHEWKVYTPILPFSDDSCGFDDENVLAANNQYSASSKEGCTSCTAKFVEQAQESFACQSTTSVTSISVSTSTEEIHHCSVATNTEEINQFSVATNTEEIRHCSVALSPIRKFQDCLSFERSQNSAGTLPSGTHSKESVTSPVWPRISRAVSPINQSFRDSGVMPINELRKDIALSPFRPEAISAATSPVRCIYRDSGVSPIRVKRLDAICGSNNADKSIQVSMVERHQDISKLLEEQTQLPEWSQEVQLMHKTFETLGINHKDLASVVTDKYFVDELKKMIEMSLKDSYRPFYSKQLEDRFKRNSFCSFEPCEFAELCNQQHYNLHLLAKSKKLEKQMCKFRISEKHKVKKLKRVKQKKKKHLTFTEEVFKEEKSQCSYIDVAGGIEQSMEVPNKTFSHTSSDAIPTTTEIATTNPEPQLVLTQDKNLSGYKSTEPKVDQRKSVYQHSTDTFSRSPKVTNNSINCDGESRSSLSTDLLTLDKEQFCETEPENSFCSGTHHNTLGSDHYVIESTTSGSVMDLCEETCGQVKKVDCGDRNEKQMPTFDDCDTALRKTSRKRQSSLTSSRDKESDKVYETADNKSVPSPRRSPRVKRIRIAHDFDSASKYSYQKGYVKFVKGETVFVHSDSKKQGVEGESNLSQAERETTTREVEKEVPVPQSVPSSIVGVMYKVNMTKKISRPDCGGSPNALKDKISKAEESYSMKRIAENQLIRNQKECKRQKVTSPKISSDEVDDTDEDRLIIACETDDSDQDTNPTKHSPANQRNVGSTNNLSVIEASEKKMQRKFEDKSTSVITLHNRSKAATGKPSKLQRLRTSVSKVHPLAQATKTPRFTDEEDHQINEKNRKSQPIVSSSHSKDDQLNLSAEVLEKFKGREIVRMAAAASGRTAQLIQPNYMKCTRPKVSEGYIKPASKTSSVQPLVRPEDRLLSTENLLSVKNGRELVQPKEKSALVVENPLDTKEESNIRKDAQLSSFLLTDDIDFRVTSQGPLAYAASDCYNSETHPCNKIGLKGTEKLVQETLQKLVAVTSFTPDVLQRAIDALSQPGLEHIQVVLVRDIVKMMDEDYDTPPLRSGKQQVFAPPLTPVQQQLLTLVLQLSYQHPHLKQLPHEVLRLLEYRMFRLGKAPEGHRLQWCSSFYTAICRVLCLRSEALIFCWDALYTLRARSYDVVKAVMDVWPHLFPINPNFEKACPNAQVMLHLLKCHVEKPSVEQNSKRFDSSWLKRMLRSSGLQSTGVNSSLLSSKIFSNLIDGTFNTSVTAMVLLAKREEEQWTMKNVISGNLLPALEKWRIRSLNDAAAERVIWTMCSILRALPPERNDGTSHTVLKLLNSELLQKDNGLLTPQMQEVIAIGLALLSKHDIESVAHSLLSWNPNHGSTRGHSSRLLQYLSSIIHSGSRPLSWWQSQLNQLPKSNLEE